jgi:uncharacterized protein YceH (UPF0502 family)
LLSGGIHLNAPKTIELLHRCCTDIGFFEVTVLLRYAVIVLFLLRTAQGLAGLDQKTIRLQEVKELV